jgi:hypothetical protein
MTVLRIPVRVARGIVTALVVVDLLALAAFAIHLTTSTTRTVVPMAAPASNVRPTPVIAPPVGGGSGGAPIAEPVSAGGRDANGAPARPVRRHVAPRHHPTVQPTPPHHKIPPIGDTKIGKCPVKLATPKDEGGVQSLVPLAPAFGPFSAEAFAAASAYQPELELLGPILAQYPKLAPKVAPLMTPLLKAFGSGSNQLYDLISPVYTPHRTQVLEAETKLAAFFAPYSEKLVATPMAGCVVDLEAALVGDTK